MVLKEKLTLKPYQQRALQFTLDNEYSALWLEMSLGKTAVLLEAIKTLIWSGEIEHALVVAPKFPATNTWPDEINKWLDFQELTYKVLVGKTPAQRKNMLAYVKTDITIISYDLLVSLVTEQHKKWPYEMVVLDEASRLKGGKKWWRAIKKIKKYTSRLSQLTGTPSPNGLKDLWAPAYLLDAGERLGRTRTIFNGRWFTPSGFKGYELKEKPGAFEDVTARCSDIALSMQTEDYLDLPDRIYHNVSIHLDASVLAGYKKLEKDFYLQLEAGEIEAQSAAAKSQKLTQYANGAVYIGEAEPGVEREWVNVHDAKLDALESVIEEANGAPVMVAYWYKTDLARLRARFKTGIELRDSDTTIKDWNAGKIPLLFAHPMSAGHGLNLQFGGNILVWFGLTWNLEAYQQTNARLHRLGQDKPVYIHHLVCEGTMDNDILERIDTKASVQDILMKRMKQETV